MDGESFLSINGSDSISYWMWIKASPALAKWHFRLFCLCVRVSRKLESAAFQASSVCQRRINLFKKFQSECFHQGPFPPRAKQWKAYMIPANNKKKKGGGKTKPSSNTCLHFTKDTFDVIQIFFYPSPCAPQLSLRAAVRLCCADERQRIVPGCVHHGEGRRRLSAR